MATKKMMQAYVNANREAVAESENPHALISVLFDENDPLYATASI